MNEALLELAIWDALDSNARQDIVRRVVPDLAPSFTFDSLRSCTLGEQSHEIAFFRFEQSEFALLPGSSKATLGYDRQRSLELTEEQISDWESTQEEWGITFLEYLDIYLTPFRHVAIPPLLVEVNSREMEYRADGNGQDEAYARILSELDEPFRLLTQDEWEYASASGSRALFRWGNYCPMSISCSEKKWNLHRLPNAFGLNMNWSTYDSEICAGPVLRGGDGGSTVCGGIGLFATWLPLAPTFRTPDAEIAEWWIDEVYVRRARPLFGVDGGGKRN